MTGHAGSPRGFTLLELAVVVCVVALLATAALERLLRYQELAEKAAMETTAAALRGALALRFAALYLAGNPEAIERLPEENPMDWLAERPPNYAGALWSPSEPPRGEWYFDRATKALVYTPHRRRYLLAPEGDPRIRFRIHVEFKAEGSAGARRELRQLTLQATPYNWFRDVQ